MRKGRSFQGVARRLGGSQRVVRRRPLQLAVRELHVKPKLVIVR